MPLRGMEEGFTAESAENRGSRLRRNVRFFQPQMDTNSRLRRKRRDWAGADSTGHRPGILLNSLEPDTRNPVPDSLTFPGTRHPAPGTRHLVTHFIRLNFGCSGAKRKFSFLVFFFVCFRVFRGYWICLSKSVSLSGSDIQEPDFSITTTITTTTTNRAAEGGPGTWHPAPGTWFSYIPRSKNTRPRHRFLVKSAERDPNIPTARIFHKTQRVKPFISIAPGTHGREAQTDAILNYSPFNFELSFAMSY
jgi:hypothetical protein